MVCILRYELRYDKISYVVFGFFCGNFWIVSKGVFRGLFWFYEYLLSIYLYIY